ncbi:MAG TPA: DUF4832 domain-containing protein [bacterium]|nr:DUF4832 domain-containing protein [bacterium]
MKLLFYSSLLLFLTLPALGRAGTVSYTVDSSTDFTNPERGWYVTMYNYGNGISQNNNLNDASWQGQVTGSGNATGDTHQVVVKRIYDLGGIYGGTDYATSGQPIDSTWLNNLTNDLNTARSLGIKLIIRFDYNEGSGTGNSGNSGGQDASLSVIQGHISQIFPILAANEDVIAYIEAGFIGQWGEWHDSTNGLNDSTNSNSTSAMTTILDQELADLPTDRMIAVRYPGYSLEIFNTTTPISAANAFNGSNYSRVGTHDDCFESDQYDGGTYAKGTNLGWSVSQFKSFLAAQNYSVAEGGETCGTSGYSTCSNSVADLQSEHWSAMHCEWDPSNISEWSSGGCLSQIDLDLGYRYALTQSTVPASVNAGAVLNLSFVVENNGWANCYNQRPMEVILRPTADSGFTGAIAIPVTESTANNTDPRFWQPGQSYTVNVSVTLPGSVTAGNYTVLLNLPDGHSSLYNSASNPAAYINYAMRLADSGVWESGDGYNNLSQTLSVVNCAGCTATPTPTNTATPAPGTGTDISIDFVGGSTNGDPTNMAAATDAGVVSLPEWNNASGASGSIANLMDNSGGSTSSTLSYSAGNAIWSLPITYSAGNYDMMGGYIDASSGASTTVTINSLPSRITANGYSVYVYFDGDNSGAARTGNYTIGSTTISGTDAANTNFSGTFTQASGGSNGNYVLFTNQSGSSFTLTASVGASTDAYPRAPINGIQIVANPPSGSPTQTPIPGTSTPTPTWTATGGGPTNTPSPEPSPTSGSGGCIVPSPVSGSEWNGNNGGTNSFTFSVSGPASLPSNPLLLVRVYIGDGAPSGLLSSVTYGTKGLTKWAPGINQIATGGSTANTDFETWYATGSGIPLGNQTLTVAWTSGAYYDPIWMSAEFFSDANQSTPLGAANSGAVQSGGTGYTSTLSTTAADSLVSSVLCDGEDGSCPSVNNNANTEFSACGADDIWGADKAQPSSGTATSITWTLGTNSDYWTGENVEILAAPCAATSPTDTGTFTRTSTATPSPASTLTASPTKTDTLSPTKTFTAMSTSTATPSASSTQTPAATSSPTKTLTVSPSASSTASPTRTGTASPSASPTFTAQSTGSATDTLTATVSPTESRTASPTRTSTASPTESSTPSPSKTLTASPTLSWTVSPTRTLTASPSFTEQSTGSVTDSPTVTLSQTPSRTPSRTETLTVSPTQSFTPSPSKTLTASPTLTSTLSPTRTLTASPSFTEQSTGSVTDSPTVTPSQTQSRTPSRTETLTISPTQSFTPSPSKTATASPTLTSTLSATRTATASPTFTEQSTGSVTDSPTVTLSRTGSPTASPTLSGTKSSTGTATASPSESPTESASGTVSASPSPTTSPDQSPTVSATLSPSPSASPSFTLTPDQSPTVSSTLSPSPSASPSFTLTPDQSPTLTATPSPSSSASQTPSATGSATQSPTETTTVSASVTASRTPSPTASASSSPRPTSTKTGTPTPSFSPTRTASATPGASPTPSPTATRAATPLPTAVSGSGPNRILATAPVPNPNPTALKVELESDVDSVVAEIYSMALVRVATVTAGPSEAGWITLPLPADFVSGAANGLYYYRVIGVRGSNQSKQATGRFLILH